MKLLLLLFGFLSFTATAANVTTYIPKNAPFYLPILKSEQLAYWTDHPRPELLAGLVETESCVTLTSSRCWSPKSRLKTYAEEGAGLGQITKAYSHGRLRFDALDEMRRLHPAELGSLSWNNVYSSPRLQLRTVVLKSKDDYDYFYQISDTNARLAFTDAAYNGGRAGVSKDRRYCAIKKGCDPMLWFGNVESSCSKSIYAKPGYAHSACSINRTHVRSVLLIRSSKYKPWMQ